MTYCMYIPDTTGLYVWYLVIYEYFPIKKIDSPHDQGPRNNLNIIAVL